MFRTAWILILLLAANRAPAQVVISQVYGGGGNNGATIKQDFVELYNRGTAPVTLTNWSLQYTSASGSSWGSTADLKVTLHGTIPPGRYFLVRLSTGAGGTVDTPTPDATGTIAMSATSGKIALVSSDTPLTQVACPTDASIVDLVGYGSPNCFRGKGAAPTLTNTTAALRKDGGAVDTGDNAADFITGTPNPRNSGYTPSGPVTPSCTPHTISEIQGSGPASPYVNQSVQTSGIVTARVSNGFYLQMPEPGDNDPRTSDGVFVFTSAAPPADAAIGNAVTLCATVSEYVPTSDPASPSLTELITPSNLTVDGTNKTLPAPVEITVVDTDPNGGLDQLEKYEGMRVSLGSLTVIQPTSGTVDEKNARSTSNGVFYGVITGIARPFREPGIALPDPLPSDAPCCIPRFDGNPERLRIDSKSQTGATPLEVTSGATVTGIAGVLTYAFRTYSVVLDPTPLPMVSVNQTYIKVPAAADGEFSVASFNMQHFFDTTDDPDVPFDVALTDEAYARRKAKASSIVRDVLSLPDILVVQELENLATLQDLADTINRDAGDPNPGYVAFLQEGNDPSGIDIGFLVKGSKVNVVDVQQVGKEETLATGGSLFDRPPLVLRLTVQGAAYTVIGNHLRSIDTDAASLTKRQREAEWLAAYIQSRQDADPTESILVVGDFNAYQFSDGYVDVVGTITGNPAPADQVLRASGAVVTPTLTDVVDKIADPDRYSYVYDGNAQVLDHVLLNGPALSTFARAMYARVNADFPESYRGDGSRPERLSDHDPVVVYFTLTAPPVK